MTGECPECTRLFEQVERHLGEISDLSREVAQAVKRRDERLIERVDSQLEHALGAKERSLGALREHRRDHREL